MAARWLGKGHLNPSLVNCSVAVCWATSEVKTVRLNLLILKDPVRGIMTR
jgi:non-homologous end joining protein Ku